MGLKDWIAIAIALYGAILSTLLAILRFREEKKKLTMILEYGVFSKKPSLVVTNSGHRPLTIRKIIVEMTKDPDSMYPEYFGPDSPKLPSLISDGETITYEFGEQLTKRIENFRNLHIRKRINCKSMVSIYDGEEMFTTN